VSPQGTLPKLRDRLSRAMQRLHIPNMTWTQADYKRLSIATDVDAIVVDDQEAPLAREYRATAGSPEQGRGLVRGSQPILNAVEYEQPTLTPTAPRRSAPTHMEADIIPIQAGTFAPREQSMKNTVTSGYQPAMIERVRAWKLEFYGNDNEGVESFLDRIEQCSLSCGLTNADLYSIMPLMLKDAASTCNVVRSAPPNANFGNFEIAFVCPSIVKTYMNRQTRYMDNPESWVQQFHSWTNDLGPEQKMILDLDKRFRTLTKEISLGQSSFWAGQTK
ncbi:hypothetical protein PV326_012089, partial [Microctonus aethiopoides]